MEKSYATNANKRKPRKSIALLLSDSPSLHSNNVLVSQSESSSSTLRFEILKCNENASILLIYNKAVVSNDTSILRWFALHGRSVRQQVANIEARIFAKRYGYKLKLPSSPLNSWIDNSKWDNVEYISLMHPSDKKKSKPNSGKSKIRKRARCEVRLATGANGKSTYSLNYSLYTHSSQAEIPTYSNRPYNSRTECLAAALDELEQRMLGFVQTTFSGRQSKVVYNPGNHVSELNRAASHRKDAVKKNALKILQSVEDMRLKLFPQQRQMMMF